MRVAFLSTPLDVQQDPALLGVVRHRSLEADHGNGNRRPGWRRPGAAGRSATGDLDHLPPERRQPQTARPPYIGTTRAPHNARGRLTRRGAGLVVGRFSAEVLSVYELCRAGLERGSSRSVPLGPPYWTNDLEDLSRSSVVRAIATAQRQGQASVLAHPRRARPLATGHGDGRPAI